MQTIASPTLTLTQIQPIQQKILIRTNLWKFVAEALTQIQQKNPSAKSVQSVFAPLPQIITNSHKAYYYTYM